MAVTVKSSGPRGAKTYEIRKDGHLYDYTDNAFDAKRIAAKARKEERGGKRNPSKSVRLTNFTGTVKLNPNKTVSVVGKAKRKNPSSKPKVKFLRTAHKGPMGQDLRNIWTCGVKDADGRYHEHPSKASAQACTKR